jgi:hypothetical protein
MPRDYCVRRRSLSNQLSPSDFRGSTLKIEINWKGGEDKI